MNLNEKQLEAVNIIEWPLLIIAWAGSGKTATLTQRVGEMIQKHQIAPRNILCVTFTNKAAREMKERIAHKLDINIEGNNFRNSSRLPYIGTFHSFWVQTIKEVTKLNAEEENEQARIDIGIKKDFIIYDASDSLSLLKQICREKSIEEKEFPARKIQTYISNAKNSLIWPKEYESLVDSRFKEVVKDIYYIYQKKLQENNAIDFDDILVKTLQAIKHPKLLEIYQERYQYIMIDEYQDTNEPQYQIVKLLASKYRNLCVVGDDWQSIYSWRGADMRNILNFQKDYPEAKIVKLEQNYRSTKKIIGAANEVIKNNQNALKKTLWTDNTEGEHIVLIKNSDDRKEAEKIVELIKKEGHPWKKNLILYRTNGQSRQIEEYLIREAIPYKVVGGMKFYDRMEVKDLIAYLKIFYNPDDTISFKRIINVPARKIGAKAVELMDTVKENYGLNYAQILENIDDVEEISGAARGSLGVFGELYKFLENSLNTHFSLSQFLSGLVDTINYKDYLKGDYTEAEYEAKIENINELINVLSTYDGMEPRVALEQFIDEVSLLSELDGVNDESDYVTLMTIHTAKWLERENVFIAGLEDGILPHIRTVSNPSELEEERRLMYVAMTRAKEKLVITTARERYQFGEYIRNPVSRFIKEIPDEFIEELETISEVNYFSNSFSGMFGSGESSYTEPRSIVPWIAKPKIENNVSDFSVWVQVLHPKFGVGTIKAMNGDIADINFAEWVKKMNIKIAPVRRV